MFTDPSCRRWVEALPLARDLLLDRLEDVLADQPSGRGDELFIGDDLEQLLDEADAIRRRWNSACIDVSELLMAIGADPRIGAELFAGLGLSADQLELLLQKGVDGGVSSPPQERPRPTSPKEEPLRQRVARVPSSSRGGREAAAAAPSAPPRQTDPLEPPSAPEASLQVQEPPTALESYGRDLTEEAEAGSLDPVIGRDAEIRNLIKVLSRLTNHPFCEMGIQLKELASLAGQQPLDGDPRPAGHQISDVTGVHLLPE